MGAGRQPLEQPNLLVVHPHGRAGSLLLQSLFDGHPNVLTLPHFGPIYSRLPQRVGSPSTEVRTFVAANPHLFDSSVGYFGGGRQTVSGGFGESFAEHLTVDPVQCCLEFDRLLGRRAREEVQPISRPHFFCLFHKAYAACVGNAPEDARYILYHPHTYREFETLDAEFPEFRFIAMTRDPRQDWASWKKVLAYRASVAPTCLSPVFMLNNAKQYAADVASLARWSDRLGPERVRVLDLPLLHQEGETAIRLLCAWLGIDFESSLLTSTFNRKAWAGNSADRRPRSGIGSNENQGRWQETLPLDEQRFLSSLLHGCISWLGYEVGEQMVDVPGFVRERTGLVQLSRYVIQRVRQEKNNREGGHAHGVRSAYVRFRRAAMTLRVELPVLWRAKHVAGAARVLSDQRLLSGPKGAVRVFLRA